MRYTDMAAYPVSFEHVDSSMEVDPLHIRQASVLLPDTSVRRLTFVTLQI